jgi:hypothetical protein
MELKLIRGGRSESRVEIALTQDQRTSLDQALDELARRLPGYAWLVQEEGTLLAKAGDPPSELTFEVRCHAAGLDPLPKDTKKIQRLGPREGTSLRVIPATASIAVPPMAILTVAPASMPAASALETWLFASRSRLQETLTEAIWIVPPPIIVDLSGSGPPTRHA